MVNLLSPGVQVLERDNTLSIPAASTSRGGVVGAFEWGPANNAVLLSNESDLVNTFGRPNDNNFTSFYTAANFLSYSNGLYVVRAIASGTVNASSKGNVTFNGNGNLVTFVLPFTPINAASIRVTVNGTVLNGTGQNPQYTLSTVNNVTSIVFATAPSGGTNNIVISEFQTIENEDVFERLVGLPSSVYAKYPGTLGNGLRVILADATTWTSLSNNDKAFFSGAPENQEIHFAVFDTTGTFSGVAGTILEKKEYLTKTIGERFPNGETAYYKQWINQNSKYVYSTGSLTDFATGVSTLSAGRTNNTITDGNLQTAWNEFLKTETIEVSVLPLGAVSSTVASYVISNIAAVRKDCIVCVSPLLSDVLNNTGSEISNILTYRTALGSSSYATMDANWKLQYDKYNDVNRWIPCNGDVAGLIAQVARTSEAWFSPAGYNNGVVRNSIKLAWNPTQAQRDSLFTSNVNPIIQEFGVGSVLLGDKTLLSRPSVFDNIGTRMLFIVLAKRIGNSAKFILFEQNDEFTRANFRNSVTPYLREVQGRRGISDFRVVADETNNNASVIENRQFVCDIYIKPITSIRFIQLNLIATREGVTFAEIGG